MKLAEFVDKLEVDEFIKIKALRVQVRAMDDKEDLDPFLEKICSDDGLKAWRSGCFTLEEALNFYRQGQLDTALLEARLITVKPFLERSPSKLPLFFKDERLPVVDHREATSNLTNVLVMRTLEQDGTGLLSQSLSGPIIDSNQKNDHESIIRSASEPILNSDAQENKLVEAHYFTRDQLRQLSTNTVRVLRTLLVKEAIQDRVITCRDFPHLLKLDSHFWAITGLFSETGINALRKNTITLAQVVRIRCKAYFQGLLTPEAQAAIQAKSISVDFITNIWFPGCKKRYDKELVAIMLSKNFLAIIDKSSFDIMDLYHKSYDRISYPLDFEEGPGNYYNGETDHVITTFLCVWIEGLKIFCSDNAQDFFKMNLAQKGFFNRLLRVDFKKPTWLDVAFKGLDGLQQAFSDDGCWAIGEKYLKFSHCDYYKSNVVSAYIRQLRNNLALRETIKKGYLMPEVILNCYKIRFELESSSPDEVAKEKYPGEYFDFFTTPIALQAFKEGEIRLNTLKERQTSIRTINKRKQYVQELGTYIEEKERAIQADEAKLSFLQTIGEEEKKTYTAAIKVREQLQGMNKKPFNTEESDALYTVETASIFGSVTELKKIISAANPRVFSPTTTHRSKCTHPLDRVPCISRSSKIGFYTSPKLESIADSGSSSKDKEEDAANHEIFTFDL